MQRRGYANRSEAVRDILRDKLEEERLEGDETGHCVRLPLLTSTIITSAS